LVTVVSELGGRGHPAIWFDVEIWRVSRRHNLPLSIGLFGKKRAFLAARLWVSSACFFTRKGPYHRKPLPVVHSLRQEWQIFPSWPSWERKGRGPGWPAMGDLGKVSSAHNVAGEFFGHR
jgi:hypothetical protein